MNIYNNILTIILFKLYYVKGSPVAPNPFECHSEDQTTVINIVINVQKEVANALTSIGLQRSNGVLQNSVLAKSGETAEFYMTKVYFSSIIDEMNADLAPYKVQLNSVITDDSAELYSESGNFDRSCELKDPIVTRTRSFHNAKKSKNESAIGINLNLYACIYKKPQFSDKFIIKKDNCGRSIGVMWNGSKKTKHLIKSTLMQALSDDPTAYATGKFLLPNKAKLCLFSNMCVGTTSTIYGERTPLITFVQRKKVSDSIPSLGGLVGGGGNASIDDESVPQESEISSTITPPSSEENNE